MTDEDVVRRKNSRGQTYYYDNRVKRYTSKRTWKLYRNRVFKSELRKQGVDPENLKPLIYRQPRTDAKGVDKMTGNRNPKRTKLMWIMSEEKYSAEDVDFNSKEGITPQIGSFDSGSVAFNGYRTLRSMCRSAELRGVRSDIRNSLINGTTLYFSMHYTVYQLIPDYEGFGRYRGESLIDRRIPPKKRFLDHALTVKEKRNLLYLMGDH
jgi:hypothetical protein